MTREIRARVQGDLQGWRQEAALRMLMNNLDPDVAKDRRPDRLWRGAGGVTGMRSRIVRCCREAEGDETLLIQSGASRHLPHPPRRAPR